MNWHKNCRKPDVSVIDLAPGQLVPFCNSCGELSPSHDGTNRSPQTNGVAGLNIPPEPSPDQRNLYWPASVRYREEDNLSNSSIKFNTQIRANRDSHGSAFISSELTSLPRKPCFKELEGRQIRLLQLHGGRLNDPIHIDLTVENFAFGLEYEALSYTWANEAGAREESCSVYCGASWDMILVTENCASALRRLRYHQKTRTIWVDAICINQEDIGERSHQVDMMAEIYACAKMVILYLGENEPTFFDSGAIAYSRQMQVEELCTRPYFSRIWVVQELAFAAGKSVICGSKTWDWASFYPLARQCPWIHNCHDRKFRESSELFSLLYDTRHCQSSDPRDQVFALLGLVVGSRAMGLTPDYSLDLAHVMIGITGYFLTHHSTEYSKRIFCLACLENVNGWPSWVPDWIGTRKAEDLIQREVNMQILGGRDLPEDNSWGPHIPLDFVKTDGPAIGQKTATLKLKGFLVAAGPSIYQMTFSRNLSFWQESVLFTFGNRIEEDNILIVYIPHSAVHLVLSPITTNEEYLVGKLSGACTTVRPEFDAHDLGIHICPHPSIRDRISPLIANTSGWVRAFFRSGMFRAVNLHSLVKPWDLFMGKWNNYAEKGINDRKLWVRILFRKAIIHSQILLLNRSSGKEQRFHRRMMRSLAQLVINEAKQNGKTENVIGNASRLIRNMTLFTQDLARLVSEGTFLDSAMTLNTFLWRVYRVCKLSASEIPEPSSSSNAEEGSWTLAFRHFLTNHLITHDSSRPDYSDETSMLLKCFIDFLCAYVACPHIAKLCATDNKEKHPPSSEKIKSHTAMTEDYLNLPNHVVEFLTHGNSIMDTDRKQKKLWQALKSDSCVEAEHYSDIDVGIKSLDKVLYERGWAVFSPQLIDVYIR